MASEGQLNLDWKQKPGEPERVNPKFPVGPSSVRESRDAPGCADYQGRSVPRGSVAEDERQTSLVASLLLSAA